MLWGVYFLLPETFLDVCIKLQDGFDWKEKSGSSCETVSVGWNALFCIALQQCLGVKL